MVERKLTEEEQELVEVATEALDDLAMRALLAEDCAAYWRGLHDETIVKDG